MCKIYVYNKRTQRFIKEAVMLENENIIGIAETELVEETSGDRYPQRFLFTTVNGGYRGYNIVFMIREESSKADLVIDCVEKNIESILSYVAKNLYISTISTIDIHEQGLDENNTSIVEYSNDELWSAYGKFRTEYNNSLLRKLFSHESNEKFITHSEPSQEKSIELLDKKFKYSVLNIIARY